MENLVFSGGCPERAAMSQNSTPPSSSSLYFPSYPPNWETLDDNKRVLSVEEDKSTSASRSHSEAEKRRRDRINAQLATLRKLIPNSEKMDKAMLLGSAIEQIRELRKKSIEINKVITIPSDVDQLIIEDNLNQPGYKMKRNISIKVSFCCEDRPEFFSELNRALKGLKLRIFEVELTSLAGRLKGVFCATAMDNIDQEKVCMDTFKRSLKLSLNRIVMSSNTTNYIIKSKRRRFFFPQSD